MRTIALEEHFASPGFLDGPGKQLKAQARQFGAAAAKLFEQLCDTGDQRVAEMDAAGIDVQVLSLTSPGTEQVEAAVAVALARESNDFLGDAVKKHPGRFAAFAALPTAMPDMAAKELERVVRDTGFQGAMINGHARGRYLDGQFFWPIFETAEAVRVPIYLHPAKPPQAVIDASYGGLAGLSSAIKAVPGRIGHELQLGGSNVRRFDAETVGVFRSPGFCHQTTQMRRHLHSVVKHIPDAHTGALPES